MLSRLKMDTDQKRVPGVLGVVLKVGGGADTSRKWPFDMDML